MINLYQGDCLDVLKTFPDNSVEAVVTDPPYGLAFMNKKWDYDVPSTAIWKEVLRVLKPGGHLLSFGGTRTYHRMVVNIEDAGFEIRDQIQWLYGSGFPKSLDISKAIDKQAGAEREVVGPSNRHGGGQLAEKYAQDRWTQENAATMGMHITAPATEAAKLWEGWGTALKPANEPIVLARKPLERGLTVAANVLKWGVGGLNIDASRIVGSVEDQAALAKNWDRVQSESNKHGTIAREGGDLKAIDLSDRAPQGRFPANLILDETAAAMLDAQTGNLHPSGNVTKGLGKTGKSMFGIGEGAFGQSTDYKDTGGASRFFYVAKASKSERNKGLEDAPLSIVSDGREKSIDNPFLRGETERKNTHPTVKPVKLMEYLVRLVTPKNGIVLDPFMGSGTTGVACKNLEVEFVGIEREEAYVKIAKARTA